MADYKRCIFRQTQCNIARRTMYLAANSPSPCMFPLKIGYLFFSAFSENVSAPSVSTVQPLEY